jgi:hypothetical protein
MKKHGFFHILLNEQFRSALKLWNSENRTSVSAKSEERHLFVNNSINYYYPTQSEKESFIFQVSTFQKISLVLSFA